MSIVNKPAAVKTGTGKGLTIERIYTTSGVHPYDTVKWERRDVVQTNWKSGEVIFEQKGVEYPEFWSVNASTIVTTKYFRGALGAENREWSLKQVIDRVVLTYTKAGKENGYFATPADAEIFEHELTHMLMHQIFSYNSPVWFNVGTNAPQQVSACFILSVDDTMESILNWYKEEGFIFKGGSGAGLNLSRIRSSKELLKSGVLLNLMTTEIVREIMKTEKKKVTSKEATVIKKATRLMSTRRIISSQCRRAANNQRPRNEEASTNECTNFGNTINSTYMSYLQSFPFEKIFITLASIIT